MTDSQVNNNNIIQNAPGSIFVRRLSYKAFDQLPKHKINSYHIKMEDDGSHGNDEVRWFILSNLSASKVNKTTCIFCKQKLTIYDRYPLIEGTFFLSPTKHDPSAVALKTPIHGSATAAAAAVANLNSNQSLRTNNQISHDNNNCTNHINHESLIFSSQKFHKDRLHEIQHSPIQYINSVCMSCLEGWSGLIVCKFCSKRWEGSHLILGSVYMFDIFASQPCCQARVTCNNCFLPLHFASDATNNNSNIKTGVRNRSYSYASPTGRFAYQQSQQKSSKLQVFNYFSHYSQRFRCGTCGSVDNHFVKPASSIFYKL